MIKVIKNYLCLLKELRLPQIGDRDFKIRFREVIEKEIKYQDVKNELLDCITEIAKLRKNKSKIPITTRNFIEALDKLLTRYIELREIEWEMFHQGATFKKVFRRGRTMGEIQEDFVNKTESFHQAIYATISIFIKLLSVIAPESFTKKMPFARNSRFLSFSKGEFANLSESIEILERSISEYRVKFIDHTSQHHACDWYTFTNSDGRAYIVYFWDNEPGEGQYIDITKFILASNGLIFKTPFTTQNVFVPTHHQLVIKSLVEFFLGVVKNLKDK
jgi:hypothetical protein